MVKKRTMISKLSKKYKISNRFSYTIIALLSVILVATGIYAFGAVPNPGHSLSQLQGCDSPGQILNWAGTNWECIDTLPTSKITPPSGCLEGQFIEWNGVGWRCPSCDLDGDGYNSPGGLCNGNDCDDLDNRAHPGQTTYYTTATPSGSFDFNCDGMVEYEIAESTPVLNQCYNIPNGYGKTFRSGDTEYGLDYCSLSGCGLKYLGGTWPPGTWEIAWGTGLDATACNDPRSAFTPDTKPAARR